MSCKCHEKSTPLTRKPTTNYGNVVLRWYSFYFYSWSHPLQQSFFFTLWFCSLLLYTGLLQVVSLRISERCHWKCAASHLSNYPAFTHRDIWRSTQQSTIVGNINHGLDADWLTVSIVVSLPTLQQSARFNCCWIIELSLSLSFFRNARVAGGIPP